MKDEITIKELQDVDIRIGKIVSAEPIEEADKLLKLEVDIGEKKNRQMVSAIREYVDDIDDLVGTLTPFVVNIEKRTIKGTESHGMLFAVGGSHGFALLTPSKKVKPGSPLL